jgi:hypothetical protein
MIDKPVALNTKVEIRNDTGIWVQCVVEGDFRLNPGDVVTFYPSVTSVQQNVQPRIVRVGNDMEVSGAPMNCVAPVDSPAVGVWVHNYNGGVSRMEAGFIIGRLHIERYVPPMVVADQQPIPQVSKVANAKR